MKTRGGVQLIARSTSDNIDVSDLLIILEVVDMLVQLQH
jgi:hypothetical protein